jgi:hypothetical protein
VTAGLVVVVVWGLLVVVVGRLGVVVVGDLVVVVVEELVVALGGAVVAVVPAVLGAADEEADAAALTATVPASDVMAKAINVMGMRTLSAREDQRAGGRAACLGIERRNRLIALPTSGSSP